MTMPPTNWTTAEISRKLADIARLPADELAEWHACVTGRSPLYSRSSLPGEIEALHRRANALKIVLSAHSRSAPVSPAASSL